MKLTVLNMDIKDGKIYSATYSDNPEAKRIQPHYAEPLRKALNKWHKERIAAKEAERRFVPRMDGMGAWRVEDTATDFELIAKFYNGNEAAAKAFAKLLNKAAKKNTFNQ